MELNKVDWKQKDIQAFQNYLKTKSRPEKIDWTKNIINTNMPVLAILSTDLKQIEKAISKGNFISFIDQWPWEFYENTAIIANLLCKIKDFELFTTYLTKFASLADNWASCDTISWNNISKLNKNNFFELAKTFIRKEKTFERRIGVDILFKFIKDPIYTNKVLDEIICLKNEKEYYVNMCVAWLVTEGFTWQRDITLEFIQTKQLNKFTMNKTIQKCRDSYRISKEDKELLLKYKM